MTEKAPHLVIAAFWTTEDYQASTDRTSAALDEIAIKGSGASVSIKNPDARLFAWLRAVQLEEAAEEPQREHHPGATASSTFRQSEDA